MGGRGAPRRDRVKGGRLAVWEASTNGWGGVRGGLLGESVLSNSRTLQELTMADVAFVVTMVAVFALVALIAKGVSKL